MKPWQAIWRLIAYRPGLYLATLIISGLSLAPALLAGWITRELFNRLDSGSLPSTGLLALLAVLAGTALGYALNLLGFVLTESSFFGTTTALLGRNLLAGVLGRPGAKALTMSAGEAISIFRDDVEETGGYLTQRGLLTFAMAVVGMTGSLSMMLAANWWVTLLAIGPLLLVVLVVRAFEPRVQAYRQRSREATGRVTGGLNEIFSAVQALKLAGAEEGAADYIDRLSEERRVVSLKEQLLGQTLFILFWNLGHFGTGAVLLLGARAMQTGSFTVGDFALFTTLLPQVFGSMDSLGRLLTGYKQVDVSFRRMARLLGAGEESDPAPYLPQVVAHEPAFLGKLLPAVEQPKREAGLAALEVRGLTYLHEGEKGVQGADLTVRAGELVVVTGRIGSGKTTLLRALLGLLPASAGEIRWNGAPVADPASFFAPPRAAYTGQVPVLFTGPLKENLLMGLEADDAAVAEAVHMAVLDRDLSEMPDGLETVVGPRGMKLSGGQIQRAAAARMFVRRPDLLVVDDLSSALDVETERLLWERIRQRGSACLAVSHRRPALQQADEIIVLKNGRVEARGRWDQLLRESEEFRALWSSDTEEAGAAEAVSAGPASDRRG